MAKSGDSQTQQSNQAQNSTTNPWAPASAELQALISRYSQQGTDVTGQQKSALDNLVSSASGVPNFGTAGAGAVNNQFNYSTAPQVGMLQDALSGLKTNIGGTASGANLDPYSTPGFGDALKTMTSDITNQVKGVYAGSGRDPSGAGSFAQSLGRGLTQGEAPVIQAEADRLRGEQQGAAGTLYNAGTGTAGQITGQQQIPLANQTQAIQNAGMLGNLFTQPAQTQLAAANTAYQQPYGNLAALLGPLTQLGGMGGQSSGTSQGTQTTTQNQSALSNILGGASTAMAMASFLSDSRAKENIEPVGKLDDGETTVYRYNYKSQPGATHIGLLAQDLLKSDPDSVTDFGDTGLLAVNYRRATDRAAAMRKAA